MINILKTLHNKVYSFSLTLYHFIGFFFNIHKVINVPRTVSSVDQLLSKYADFKPNVSFVQIGSNDGISNDPIHKYIVSYKWRGILVEPIDFIFRQLQLNYSNKNSTDLIFENCAIGAISGELELFQVNPAFQNDLPQVFFQLASFDIEVIRANLRPYKNLENAIVSKKITVKTVQQLLDENAYNKVDLLHIDTEGYDNEIINSIDFSIIFPDIILFEHRHLGFEVYKNLIKSLRRKKYVVVATEFDTICLSSKISKIFNGIKYQPFFWRNQIKFTKF